MSKIEWLCRPGTKPESWNPVTGCRKVSEGCRNCYAAAMAARFWGDRKFTDVRCHKDRLYAPLSWRKPRTVFVNSMSDLFHDAVADEFIDRVFAVMALCPQHTFVILTKRPERMLDWATHDPRDGVRNAGEAMRPSNPPRHWYHVSDWNLRLASWPLPNVWLGVSIEDQPTADQRIPILLQTPAAVRCVSIEPLLGPVRLKQQNPDGKWPPDADQPDIAWLRHRDWPDDFQYWTTGLNWVIVGGESGPKARPCDVAWIRSTIRQCKDAGVPCFVKQLGARSVENSSDYCCGKRVRLRASKGNDPAEWPEDLRVREWPEVTA
jgi:protein gp37